MRPVVIVVEPDGDSHLDFLFPAAWGLDVKPSEIEAVVNPYCLDGRFTIIFDLDGTPPRVLPNTEKGNGKGANTQ